MRGGEGVKALPNLMRVKVDTSQTVIGSEYPGLPGYKLVKRSSGRSLYRKFNRLLGVGSYIEFDHTTKQVTVGKIQDSAPIIEHNKRAQNNFAGYKGRSVVSQTAVPIVLDQKLKEQCGMNHATGEYDEKKYRRIINDADYRYLKTVPGTI